jgi:hypothetical protein
MATRVFENTLREFNAAVADTRTFMDFAIAAGRIRPWIQKMVVIDGLDGAQKAALTRFVSQKDYQMETGFNGLYVLLAGVFEQFVRQIVRDGVLWLNKSCATFEDLADELRIQNLYRTGLALSSIHEPPVELALDFEAMCRNLGTCCSGGGDLVLNADAFTSRISNITPKRIADSLERIGVAIDWDVFGRDSQIQKLFGVKKVREAANELGSWLSAFIAQRNRIAHTGAVGIQITENELEKALDVLTAMAPVLARAVADKL